MKTFLRLTALLALALLAACSTLRPMPYRAPEGLGYRSEVEPDAQGLQLYGQFWLPPQGLAPRALVLIVHGTAEHSGLYAPVAEALAQHGYGVYGLDLQGWGRSEGLGARGFVNSHDDYVGDVRSTLNDLHRQYPGVPVFGVGESLGGTVLLRGQILGGLNFQGLILSDPGYKPNPGLGGLRGPGVLASLALFAGGLFGEVLPRWPTIPVDPALHVAICSAKTRQRFLEDPDVAHNWLPAAYIATLHDSEVLLEENLDSLTTSLLIIHGEKDSLIPLASSQEIIRRAHTRDKSLYVIPGGCHASLVEEKSWPLALAKMTEWLDQHTPPTSRTAMP